MIAPCIGPHIRAHGIGGPECRIVRSPISGTAARAGPIPSRAGCAD